jgi:hypothetical protein
MAQVITNISPTTELQAVNAMLAAIGESPVSTLDGATQADVQMALNELLTATRELQNTPWRFNFEQGFEVAPAAMTLWTDSQNNTTGLNIFKVPSNVSSWRMTFCTENGDLDLVQRPGKQYIEDGDPVPILYDRAHNRDGADAETYPFVYLDIIYSFNFEDLPETARRYITVVAARRFIQSVDGSTELYGFTARDEAIARRNFLRDQSEDQELNMLNTATAFMMLGARPRESGRTFVRVMPGSNPVPVPFRLTDLTGLRRVD